MKQIRMSKSVQERFSSLGIDHISPSSVNKWIGDSGAWYLNYIMKVKSSGPAMWRGTAVENGLVYGYIYRDRSIEDCVNVSMESFTSDAKKNESITPNESIESIEDERILAMDQVAAVIEEFRTLFPVEQFELQKKVETDIGIEVPMIGYIDIITNDRILDIKSVKAMPSSYETVKAAHIRQMAFYSYVTGLPASIVYVARPPKTKSHTGIKVFDIPPKDVERHMVEIILAARAIRRFLMNTKSEEEMSELIIPNFDSFYWDSIMLQKAHEVWGI